MTTPNTFFQQSSFGATSGLDINTINATINQAGLTPGWVSEYGGSAYGSGYWLTNGSGSVVCNSAGSQVAPNSPVPASGNSTATVSITSPSGAWHTGIYLSNITGGALALDWQSTGAVQISRLPGSQGGTSGTIYSGTLALGITAGTPYTVVFSENIVGGVATLTATINGVAIPTQTCAPLTTSGGPAMQLVNYTGTTTVNSVTVQNALPVSATFSGPSTSAQGSQSTAFSITLNDPAPVGGQIINLASSVGGDTFQASSGGGNVTAITVAAGATLGTFYVNAATAGARTITPTSSGITFAPTTLSITATATAAASFTLTGPSVGIAGSASANFTIQPNGNETGTFTPTPATGCTFTPSTLTWSGDASAKTFTVTRSTAGVATINGTFSNGITPPASVTYTAYSLALTPSTQSVADGVAATLTATLTGGSGSLAAATSGGTLSTAAPTSGQPFTLTTQSTGTGTDTVQVTHAASGATASATVTYATAPATSLTLGAPSAATLNGALTASVTPNGNVTSGTATITPSGSAAVGLSPVVITFSNTTTPQTASFTPTVAGSLVLTLTTTTGLSVQNSPATIPVTAFAGVISSVAGFPAGLVGGTTSGFGYQVSINGGAYGTLQTANIANDCGGTYSALVTAMPGSLIKVLWSSGSGAQALDASPQATPVDPLASTTVSYAASGTIGYAIGHNLDAQVSTRSTYSGGAVSAVTGSVTVGGYASGQDPATLVLDVAASAHNTANTIGARLNASGSSADPWATALPGNYTVGEAGYLVGHNLDTNIGSRSAYAGGDTSGTTTLLARIGMPATTSVAGDIAALAAGSGLFLPGTITTATSSAAFVVQFSGSAPPAAGLVGLYCCNTSSAHAPAKQPITAATVVDSTHLALAFSTPFGAAPSVGDTVLVG